MTRDVSNGNLNFYLEVKYSFGGFQTIDCSEAYIPKDFQDIKWYQGRKACVNLALITLEF